MLQGAVLDAHGASRQTIASTLDIAVTTVKDWRSRDEYKAEVERLKGSMLERFETSLDAVDAAAIRGFLKANKAAEEIVDARDEDGEYAHPTTARLEAMKLLNDQFKSRFQGRNANGGEGASVAAAAAIIVVDRNGDVIEGVGHEVR